HPGPAGPVLTGSVRRPDLLTQASLGVGRVGGPATLLNGATGIVGLPVVRRRFGAHVEGSGIGDTVEAVVRISHDRKIRPRAGPRQVRASDAAPLRPGRRGQP